MQVKLGIYRHFKGKKYRVLGTGECCDISRVCKIFDDSEEHRILGVGKHSETLENLVIFKLPGSEKFIVLGTIEHCQTLVIYKSLYKSKTKLWVRPISNFVEEVPDPKNPKRKISRFEYVG